MYGYGTYNLICPLRATREIFRLKHTCIWSQIKKTLTILKLLGSKICDCSTICVVGYSEIYCYQQKSLFNPLRTKE